jgi:RNA polymerase sigma factor (sigma-70 family)
MAPPDILTQKQKLKAAFKSLLGVDAKFLPIVQRKLNQYGLYHIEPFEILSEVYLRSIRAIEKGQIIENPRAWCRTVAFNVINDKMRNQYRDKKHFNFIELDAIECIDNIEHEIVSQNFDEDEDADLDKKILQDKLLKALDELNPEDRMIFDLRFKQDLSWENVRKHLESSGKKNNTSALRKRGERIKKQIQQYLLTK